MLSKSAMFLFMLFYVHSARSLRCFYCSSYENAMCLDPSLYDKETLAMFVPKVICGQGLYPSYGEDYFCKKIVQTAFEKGENYVHVMRGCGRGSERNTFPKKKHNCYNTTNAVLHETICECFNESCNGAAAATISLFTISVWMMLVSL